MTLTTAFFPNLKRVNLESIDGYVMADLEAVMHPDTYAALQEYMDGQTMALVNGDLIVYTWDLERFLMGLPVND